MFLIIIWLVCVAIAFKCDYDKKHQFDNIMVSDPEPLQDTPHYIIDQITALNDQININHSFISDLDNKMNLEYDSNKIKVLEKKRSELLYKTAKLEEKREKLLTKYNLDYGDYIL